MDNFKSQQVVYSLSGLAKECEGMLTPLASTKVMECLSRTLIESHKMMLNFLLNCSKSQLASQY